MGSARRLSSNTESLTTWATVEEWVRECSEQHCCLAEVDTKWYPTRLVERLSNKTFRVIRSDSDLFKPDQGYITLSHRWGNDNFLKLTAENLSAFKYGQPIKTLRKTFRDTLIVAKRLNIPYVWIDSLCIIQSGDDGADWRRESIAMAEVYSNSLCNISADWGNEFNGLFFERTPGFQPPFLLKMQWNACQNSHCDHDNSKLPRPPPDGAPIYIVCRDGWSENSADSPLNRRGWVLQERLLAPRVLHFSPRQVSWECGKKMLWEAIPLNLMDSRPTGLPTLDTHAHSWRVSHHMEHLKLYGLRSDEDWPSIVAHYSTCQLTNVSDKLVAIAGIARKLGPILKDQYVVGLWTRSLPRALLWCSRPAQEARCRRTQYFAPSFSWAAAGGQVSLPEVRVPFMIADVTSAAFIKHRKNRFPTTLNQEMRAGRGDEILEDDVFGPLSAPHVEVRLRGKLRSCYRVPPRLVPLEMGTTYACPSTGVDDSAARNRFDNHTSFIVEYDHVGQSSEGVEFTVFYFIVIERFDHVSWKARGGPPTCGHRPAKGLFLKSVDARMGRFERVGLTTHYWHQGCPETTGPLGNERDLPAWSYDETTGEHTIYVV